MDQHSADKARTGQELKIISIHLGPEVNASNCLARIRVVPDRRVGNLVYGRSIRPNEPDNGQGIPIFDEMSLSYPVGSIRFTIADVECHSELEAGGYAPAANFVWTWLALPPWAHRDSSVKDAKSVEQISAEIIAHLAENPIFSTIDEVLRTFLQEMRAMS